MDETRKENLEQKKNTKDAYCMIPCSQRSKEARLNMTVMTVDTLGVTELFLNMSDGYKGIFTL